MTIDRFATPPASAALQEDLVQFVFRPAVAASLLQHARALLAAAPQELAASFEQAVRASDLAA